MNHEAEPKKRGKKGWVRHWDAPAQKWRFRWETLPSNTSLTPDQIMDDQQALASLDGTLSEVEYEQMKLKEKGLIPLPGILESIPPKKKK